MFSVVEFKRLFGNLGDKRHKILRFSGNPPLSPFIKGEWGNPPLSPFFKGG